MIPLYFLPGKKPRTACLPQPRADPTRSAPQAAHHSPPVCTVPSRCRCGARAAPQTLFPRRPYRHGATDCSADMLLSNLKPLSNHPTSSCGYGSPSKTRDTSPHAIPGCCAVRCPDAGHPPATTHGPCRAGRSRAAPGQRRKTNHAGPARGFRLPRGGARRTAPAPIAGPCRSRIAGAGRLHHGADPPPGAETGCGLTQASRVRPGLCTRTALCSARISPMVWRSNRMSRSRPKLGRWNSATSRMCCPPVMRR